jgi:Putative auto-transporter adhesin, head GIN domain
MQRSGSASGVFLLLFPLVTLPAGCAAGSHQYGMTAPSPAIVGSGRFVTESRQVQGFTRIVVTGAIRAAVAHTGVESVEITAEDNILPLIDTSAAGGTLTLRMRDGGGGITSHGIDVRVGVRELRGGDVSGASQLDVDGLSGRDFTMTVSGASRFTASGSIDSLDVDVSGASRAQTPSLAARAARARVTGASSALIRAVDTLTATVSGVSILEYLGDPSLIATVSDTSTVRRVGP